MKEISFTVQPFFPFRFFLFFGNTKLIAHLCYVFLGVHLHSWHPRNSSKVEKEKKKEVYECISLDNLLWDTKTREDLKLMQLVVRTRLELKISRFQVQHPNQPTSLDLHEMHMCTSLTYKKCTYMCTSWIILNLLRMWCLEMHIIRCMQTIDMIIFQWTWLSSNGHDYLLMYRETRKQNFLMTRVVNSQ